MGQNNIAANILQALLGWIQSLFNGIWALFSGGSGGSLLKWLSERWLSLLVFFIAIGVIMDIFIYLVRWKPYWWWFRKKRLVIDDEILEKKGSTKAPKPVRKSTKKPSTYIPKRISSASDEDLFFEDESIFDVKPKKKKDVFEVGRKSAAASTRRTARR